ncbi:hypothetical protein RN001_004499 [Aquatica leii]|uniref:Uncharacterized protein n=1 Tax=Aquatica leii TaxID=1421715 RepID=A0AAN7Q5V1_9COLE|nr:hypothetical protein RN001_004499 [Aquatica leii]
MKLLIVMVVVIEMVITQRPNYLSGSSYPQLANRFKPENTEATTIGFNNRLGENSGTTEKIPVDARGDAELINRIKTWPRENVPFWVLNADHIENHRNMPTNQVPQEQLQQRPRQ